ncbi:MAG: hypothetical protein A2X81_04490 [Desulfobacterales bacterium GWB2_56_26]|nr:MAG: hypothetical protein A2X81_04490 [Desulfobacterales bacterium GWB2_56_26]
MICPSIRIIARIFHVFHLVHNQPGSGYFSGSGTASILRLPPDLSCRNAAAATDAPALLQSGDKTFFIAFV